MSHDFSGELAQLFRRDISRLRNEIASFAEGQLLWQTLPGITNSAGNLALHLEGKTYRLPLERRADPLSSITQREYDQQFAQQQRYYDLFSRIDVMLNELHRVRASLASEKRPQAKQMIARIDAMVATLTSNPVNFEDSLQTPGKLREDAMALLGDEPLSQATLNLYARLQREYAQRAVAYNAWVRSVAAFKTIATPRVAATR